MKTVATFQWNDAKRGQRIEDFIHMMTCDRPLLMRDVLKIGIGDLRSWTNTGVVVGATCGCLIGTCAIAATRVYEDFDALRVEAIDTPGEFVNLVPTTLAAAIARGSKKKAEHFDSIGVAVSEECDVADVLWYDNTREVEREDAVRGYLSDLIATDLRLLGVSVPRTKVTA